MAPRARRLAPSSVPSLSAFMALLDVTVVTAAVPSIAADLSAGPACTTPSPPGRSSWRPGPR
ncbi:hypothetical protein [Actinomadura sp. 3N508]|uniref:hypothetical protein n=1 Tax=Actinomadura sp. 3N508 TaxID=3375153 RepID=UPI0037B64AA9